MTNTMVDNNVNFLTKVASNPNVYLTRKLVNITKKHGSMESQDETNIEMSIITMLSIRDTCLTREYT